MRMCRNEHVLPLCASFVVDYDLWLVTPLMDKGALCRPAPSPAARHCLLMFPFCVYCARLRVLRHANSEGAARHRRQRRAAGELLAHIRGCASPLRPHPPPPPLPVVQEEAIAVIIRQALMGLDYLHAHSQIHRCGIPSRAPPRCPPSPFALPSCVLRNCLTCVCVYVGLVPCCAACRLLCLSDCVCVRACVGRDVKASNLLLDSTGTVRIADFGVAGWMDDITSREGKREVTHSPTVPVCHVCACVCVCVTTLCWRDVCVCVVVSLSVCGFWV